MGSLPPAKAGVGSAMNDVVRELGGTLGVAVLGSVLTSSYGSGMDDATAGLPPAAAEAAGDSVGAAHADRRTARRPRRRRADRRRQRRVRRRDGHDRDAGRRGRRDRRPDRPGVAAVARAARPAPRGSSRPWRDA